MAPDLILYEQSRCLLCAGRQIIFRVRRPMYLINSTIYVEDGEGNTVGEVAHCSFQRMVSTCCQLLAAQSTIN